MLTDLEARKYASYWHGGGGSPLYALTSTGALVKGVHQEIDECASFAVDRPHIASDLEELRQLSDYVKAHYPRGPVDGWSDLRW